MDESKKPAVITYVKLEGDDYDKALDSLRDMSMGMPEVCVMDTALYSELEKGYPLEKGGFIYSPLMTFANQGEGLLSLFRGVDRGRKCVEVISNKAEELGDYDFFFEWFENPAQKQIDKLEQDIEKKLKPFDVEYEISTKKP